MVVLLGFATKAPARSIGCQRSLHNDPAPNRRIGFQPLLQRFNSPASAP
jgi:hypothetical protein